MDLTIAWLTQGKLRIKTPGNPPRTIESQFGKDIKERAVRNQQRHSWKLGGGDKFLSGTMLWGRAVRDPAAIRVDITSLCRGTAAGQLMYSLETDDLCAILKLENYGEEERRLWNKNDKRLSHLCFGPSGEMACSVSHNFGTANIAVRLDEDSGLSDVTEGDSIDTAPQWVPGQPGRLVYQSAGIGRNRYGHFATLGPFTIQQLDIDTGTLTQLAEEPGADLIWPRVGQDGVLYYVRRPYKTGSEMGPLKAAKDVLLLPFRLLYAILQFLQFFSMTFTGRKLSGSGGAQAKPMDMKEMIIWGNRVSAENVTGPDDEAPDLVPNTWQLMRQRRGYDPEVIAKGVLAYDLCANGQILYSNGSAIFLRNPEGKIDLIHKEPLIEQCVFV